LQTQFSTWLIFSASHLSEPYTSLYVTWNLALFTLLYFGGVMLALVLVSTFLIGLLPLGSLFIKVLTGKSAREFSAHNLGVENVFYFIGPVAAIGSFLFDALKALGAVLLFPQYPWAALGVYIGHLYPLPVVQDLPRGRGNGVLLGIFAAWFILGYSWWMILIPLAVYAALLTVTRYVAFATLGGLTALIFATLVLVGTGPLFYVAVGLLLTSLWRHKANLARIFDHTEPKLGEPYSVHGRNPKVVLAAFMIHPLNMTDLWQPRSHQALKYLWQRGWISETLVLRLMPHLNPGVQDEIKGIKLKDGRELRVLLIGGPMMPEQIRENPKAALRMAIKGARLARERGAEAFGLGAFWSTVGNKGQDVQKAVPNIAITNGGAYTAGTIRAAIPGLMKSFEHEGGSLKQSCAAVIGANGVVAFGVARMLAPNVSEVILIGRDREKLERSAESLRTKFPATLITVSTNIRSCAEADIIVTATSDPYPVLFAPHVKPGAWIFDIGRPADVDESVRDVPGVHIIPGGVVHPPGEILNHLNLHFGNGMIPACMAETMIMTATKAFDRKSLGATTKTTDIEFYLEEGEHLGFEIITRDERVVKVSELV
jgi:acyl-phosphate glycerol 3-phosphate acyltransferase